VAAFVLDSIEDGLVATVLGAEHAIGVRHGRFCAHPLLTRLLRLSEDDADAMRARVADGDRERLPGALRASLGVGTRDEDVDALIDALAGLIAHGPAWTYSPTDAPGHYAPDPDPRELPELSCRLVRRQR
jgi:selenocysteine lyase/cysteine desulfurase